jgi:hypothetical protein
MNQKKAEVTPLMQVAIKPLMAHTASFRAPMNQKEGRGKMLLSSKNTTPDGSHSLLQSPHEPARRQRENAPLKRKYNL